MCSLHKFTNGAFSHVNTPRPMGRTSLSTSQIRAMILQGLELCQSCCTTMKWPSSSTHCWVKLFNRVFLLLGFSICHVTKERRNQDHATYPIPSHLGLLEVFNKSFCIMEEMIVLEEVCEVMWFEGYQMVVSWWALKPPHSWGGELDAIGTWGNEYAWFMVMFKFMSH